MKGSSPTVNTQKQIASRMRGTREMRTSQQGQVS